MNLNECIRHMEKWFFADTIELLEQVLTDDAENPAYSAITALNRLYIYVEFHKKTGNFGCDGYRSLFRKMGYSEKVYEQFRLKAEKERVSYTSEIYDASFFQE